MPTIPEALNQAHHELQAGDPERARFIYRQILQAAPDEPNSLNGLGVLEFRAGRLDAAEQHIRRAIAIHPRDPTFHNNLHLVYRRQGRPSEAVECCRRALTLAGDWPELHNNLGIALGECGAHDEAIASLRTAIRLRPTYADAHYNLANALARLDRLDQAEAEYRQALELAPSDDDIHNNLGTLLQSLGKFDEAMACYETALRLRNASAEAHRNRALLWLLRGNFSQGWTEYEWRWRMPRVEQFDYSRPRWQGQPLGGRTILLQCEQGLGDTIQFIRYAALVKQSGARVLVNCPPRLAALLQTAPGVDRLLSGGADEEPFEYWIPLLSLPGVFGTTMPSIPAAVPYLAAEPARVAHWHDRLAAPDKLKVGIAWQGNPAVTSDAYRSIPLERFAPLADVPGVQLFSLQKGLGQEQLAPLAERLRIVDLSATLDTGDAAFLDTAAVMTHLDLVVTSDTSIAHLAGALGVPVWVALAYAPNWRWLLDRNDSPWYPTMRLFRQPRCGAWDDVFADVAAALRTISPTARSV